MTGVKNDLLRRELSLCLDEDPSTFDAITDQIERSADLVKQLGGLGELSEFDRARISHMIESQVGMGIERGDFDFVFRRQAQIKVPEFQIARLELKPGDTVVVKSSEQLTGAYVEAIKHMAAECFPRHRLLILADNLELYVLGKDAP